MENVDSGSDKVTMGERTPFINAGSAVDDASAAVNQVDIGIDGVVTVVNTIAVWWILHGYCRGCWCR